MSEGWTGVGDVYRVDWSGLGVTACHGCDRESECEGMGTRLHYDREGSEILVRELLGGVHRLEVLSFHIDFISYLEVWWSGSSSICRTLIALLR